MSDFAAALAHFQRGDLAAAETVLNALIAREPRHADAVHMLASVRHARGDAQGAADLFEQAVKLAPQDAAIAFNRALVLVTLGRNEQAVAAFEHALRLRPRDTEALFGYGAALAAVRRFDDAFNAYESARAAGLDRADLHANRGAVLGSLQRHAEAVAACDRALALAPNDAKAHYNRGASLLALDRPADAVGALDRALALAPDHIMARIVRGTALGHLGRFDDALTDLGSALVRQPERADTWFRRGFVLSTANRMEEAVAAYDRVLALKPDDAISAFSKADALLTLGDFAQGLPLYEARLRMQPSVAAQPQAPLWTGAEPLKGKRILVQSEQGFGDLFQFCRFIPELAARGAEIVLQERPQTFALMRSLAGVKDLAPIGAQPPQTDFRIPIASLMLALGIRLETIPAPIPYLHAEEPRVARWRETLGPAQRRRIGMCWRGGMHQLMQRWRRLDAASLERLLTADADFISLQMDDGAEAPILRARGARSFGAATADFADLAALIETLDLVITIDTAAAHVAGALGKPVWILLPYHPDWRWLLKRADTPWYPQARLFRQNRFNDWPNVIDDVLAALQ